MPGRRGPPEGVEREWGQRQRRSWWPIRFGESGNGTPNIACCCLDLAFALIVVLVVLALVLMGLLART